MADRSCYVADELANRYWRRGIGSSAVGAMLTEPSERYDIGTFVAVLKARNDRSKGLLRKLGFVMASDEQVALHRDEIDELVLVNTAAARRRDENSAVLGTSILEHGD